MDLRGIIRAALLIAAAVVWAVGAAFAAEPLFGTFTDARDGKTYKTVKVGRQTWMAQNLDYLPPPLEWDKSWCYDDSNSSCKKYGRLYNWGAAMRACPAGWHLPSRQEWDDLGQAVGGRETPDDDSYVGWYGAGKKLKAASGWEWNDNDSGNGTDNYGFSALPGGIRCPGGDCFSNIGDVGYWWTTTNMDKIGIYYAYNLNISYRDDNLYVGYNRKDYGISVRCVQDDK